VDNGLIGEGRELNRGGNTSVLEDSSSIVRLAPPLFLEFIVAHSMAEQIACVDRELR